MKENEVKQIPRLINEGKTLLDIAAIYKVHPQTVNYWVRRYRKSGKVLNIKKGRPFKFKL